MRDVCQKIFPPTAWSLMGIAGDLCLSNALAEATFDRLKATEWAEDLWLDHDDEVRAFVAAMVGAHTGVRPGHEGCVREGPALLISWIGLVNFNRADGTLDHQEPGTKAMAVTSPGDIERQQRLADPLVIRNRAESIAPDLTREEGKTLREALGEATAAAELLEFLAGEGRRIAGRHPPSAQRGVALFTRRRPLGSLD